MKRSISKNKTQYTHLKNSLKLNKIVYIQSSTLKKKGKSDYLRLFSKDLKFPLLDEIHTLKNRLFQIDRKFCERKMNERFCSVVESTR